MSAQPDRGLTYHQWAQGQAELESQGRFATTTKAEVIGGGGAYPKLPEGNPFVSDPVPPEQPLGFSVEALPPVGELHELTSPATPPAVVEPADVNPRGSRGDGVSASSPLELPAPAQGRGERRRA